jgi:hypothetical protein
MACAIEDAGFEIRDMIEWIYGSGFPKSLNIGKAIDKLQGNERTDIPNNRHGGGSSDIFPERNNFMTTKGNTPYEGFGTALKPAHEPICLARKPLSENTVAENVLKHGTGGMNIDGCRVETKDTWSKNTSATAPIGKPVETVADHHWGLLEREKHSSELGRFSANLILSYPADTYILSAKDIEQELKARKLINRLFNDCSCPNSDVYIIDMDGEWSANCGGCGCNMEQHIKKRDAIVDWNKAHPQEITIEETLYNKMPDDIKACFVKNPNPCSDEVLAVFPNSNGGNGKPRIERSGDSTISKTCGPRIGGGRPVGFETQQYADSGSASRFFYTAKASKSERNAGLDGFEEKRSCSMMGCVDDGNFLTGSGNPRQGTNSNNHPTVKPISLMRYLTRLVTPPSGTVLDPFAGSGTTGCACALEGFDFIGIEREADYVKIAEARIDHWKKNVPIMDKEQIDLEEVLNG